MAEASDILSEIKTTTACLHPYFGYVCPPNTRLDLSSSVPPHFGHGAVAHIDCDGFRNGDRPARKPNDEFWIGLFGGSAAFSYTASDNDHTISGCLERRLNDTRSRMNGRVRVLNFALPAAQQPQQLLIFLLKADLLDGVITFDGVNEVVVPGWYNRGSLPVDFPYLPFYRALYGRAIADEQIALTYQFEEAEKAFEAKPQWQRTLGRRRHDRMQRHVRQRLNQLGTATSFQSLFLGRSRNDLDVILDAGADNWVRQSTRMAQLCRTFRIQTLLGVQPIPDRFKPLTALEDSFLKDHVELLKLRADGFDRVHRQASQLQREGFPLEDFGDVFSSCTQTIYTDLIHFEDAGCDIVAARLAASVRARWDGLP